MSQALEGIRVIDFTHDQAGPSCTQMLAWLGADVIKIERPPNGDRARKLWNSDNPNVDSFFFLLLNSNKRSTVIDLKSAEGKEIARRLIKEADVVAENLGPGVMDRLGFGYPEIKKDHPALIYCSLSGFGRTGPYKHRRGFDLVAQAMSGIMSFTGERPDGPPVKCGAPLSDITAGLLAAMGILAAYTHRLKTGQGQWVETSLFEAALVQTYWQAAIALATDVAPKAMGSAHPLNAPYQAFEASDKWIVVGGANQKHWLRTLEVLGVSELAQDPRFATGADRMGHLKELEDLLSARFRTQPAAHWLSALEEVGVPCGPVNNMLQALADPQTIAREMVTEVAHSSLGKVKTIGLPIKFSETPGKVRSGAPLYGEHTAAVLTAYGFGADEIAALQEEGAVATAGPVKDKVS